MLEAHLYPGEDSDGAPLPSANTEIRRTLYRRNLFWVCYTLDKEVTFRTGRPPIINDTSCDLTFPKRYSEQILYNNKDIGHLPGNLGLSVIKSQAYEKLYSRHSLRKSDAELLKDIRELDDLLEEWRQSLPLECRPTLSFSQDVKSWIDVDHLHTPFIVMRLEYYHCMTTIHQASSRCKNWTNNRRIDQGLSSSQDLALEASRSMLSYLHAGNPNLAPNLFWYVTYPSNS